MIHLETDRDRFFEALFREQWSNLFKSAQIWLSDQMAEDVVQQTFERAYKRLDVLTDHPNPIGWLRVTMWNVAREEERAYKRCIGSCFSMEDQFVEPESPNSDPSKLVMEMEYDAMLREILSELREEDAYLFWKIVGKGASHREMARELNISECNSQKRLERIKKRARKIAENKYGKYFK